MYILKKQLKKILKMIKNSIHKLINLIIYFHKYQLHMKWTKMKYSAKFKNENLRKHNKEFEFLINDEDIKSKNRLLKT